MGVEYGAEAFFSALLTETGGARDDALFLELLTRIRDVSGACVRCINTAIMIYGTRYPILR